MKIAKFALSIFNNLKKLLILQSMEGKVIFKFHWNQHFFIKENGNKIQVLDVDETLYIHSNNKYRFNDIKIKKICQTLEFELEFSITQQFKTKKIKSEIA